MNYINNEPKTGKNGEIRYYCFISYDSSILLLLKVKCKSKRWDKDNNYYIYYCEILEKIIDKFDHHIGSTIIVDESWTLQDNLEKAQRLMILGLFNERAFYNSTPVWEKI
ncbi:MAG: hypothetical protein ACOC3V_03535 [bacterium]